MKDTALSGLSTADMDTYSWRRRLLMACLAILLYFAVQLVLIFAVGKASTLWMSISASLVVLLIFAWVERRHSGGVRALVGHDLGNTLKHCAPWVLGAYLVSTGLDVGFGYWQEPTPLAGTQSMTKKLLLFAMTLVIISTLEELLYRHFLIRLFPLGHRRWRYVAILFTTALYMLMHMPYAHWTNFLLVGTLSIILGYARVRSAGLLVPVLLHIFAGVLSLLRYFMATLWF
ncbi:type II CAAX endopeptidase family protein [Pseudomonas sp. EYE_354]|uniref:CPBP family intramembrane glutamic endopeptidase n=1 Tax=Pseudomonas sp. EYE_354 TaxID=2853449 RepID=UPI0020053508|nr:CPBP family intramembrane metalloprotease [Pseudomonas sp. EYE_354]